MDIKNKKTHLTQDELIVDYIKDQLEEKMEASAMDVNVTCRDGVVQLAGFVDLLAEKKMAEEVSKIIDGVKRVENNLTIGMDSKITDKHIEKEVMDKLQHEEEHEGIAGVGVKVYDGSVSLVGHVDTLKSAQHAMEVASKTRGVKDVVNNIEISTANEFDDVTINNAVRQAFNENHEMSGEDIACDVNEGIVTLRGFAADKHKVELAKEIAVDIGGVRKVRNFIKVRD